MASLRMLAEPVLADVCLQIFESIAHILLESCVCIKHIIITVEQKKKCFLNTVLHTSSWLTVMPFLYKMLESEQKSCHHMKCVVICCKMECLRSSAVARVSLDITMSVAGSVIFSLLLISGDIEENPGPGPDGTKLFSPKLIVLFL